VEFPRENVTFKKGAEVAEAPRREIRRPAILDESGTMSGYVLMLFPALVVGGIAVLLISDWLHRREPGSVLLVRYQQPVPHRGSWHRFDLYADRAMHHALSGLG
jgi:hypothetical protein